ncbi:MAG: DedA family protein [Chlamydiia bacterium]
MVESFTESLHELVRQHPDFAPLFVFFCIALSSFTFVVSLDLLILTGALSGAYFNSFTPFFIACFLGTFFCGQTDYWIGRILGERMLRFPRIAKALPPEKLIQMQGFFDRYGAITFIVGRFIPFGFRLVMFLGAGLFKFRYRTFVLADLIASFIWTGCMFSLFFYFGQHAHFIKEKIVYIVATLAIVGVLVLTLRLIRKRYAISTNADLVDKDPASARVPNDEL